MSVCFGFGAKARDLRNSKDKEKHNEKYNLSCSLNQELKKLIFCKAYFQSCVYTHTHTYKVPLNLNLAMNMNIH